MRVGDEVEVAFAINRGARYELGTVRQIRYAHGALAHIRAVVVRLHNGRLCVAHPSSLRNRGTKS